jgi:hypothetical protein
LDPRRFLQQPIFFVFCVTVCFRFFSSLVAKIFFEPLRAVDAGRAHGVAVNGDVAYITGLEVGMARGGAGCVFLTTNATTNLVSAPNRQADAESKSLFRRWRKILLNAGGAACGNGVLRRTKSAPLRMTSLV